jgi:hypothetical protein
MTPRLTPPDHREAGSTLPELLVSLLLLGIVAAGLLSMQAVATKTTENYGHLSSRTTEYAQDKMEQLLVLAFGDQDTNTAVFPAVSSGGTGLKAGGSSSLSTPATGYYDYLDQNGNLLAVAASAPSNWYYKRVWSVTDVSATLKQITVTVGVKSAFAGGQAAESTVTALKTSPF